MMQDFTELTSALASHGFVETISGRHFHFLERNLDGISIQYHTTRKVLLVSLHVRERPNAHWKRASLLPICELFEIWTLGQVEDDWLEIAREITADDDWRRCLKAHTRLLSDIYGTDEIYRNLPKAIEYAAWTNDW